MIYRFPEDPPPPKDSGLKKVIKKILIALGLKK
jgi:hypothetical protein